MTEEGKKNLHIGMRKIKSLLAILIGFVIWQLIRLIFPDLEVHPIYIYIYGLIEIRDTSEKTRKMGLGRIKATLTALAVGLPMLLLRIYIHSYASSSGLEILADLLLILIGVLLTMAIGQKVGCGPLTGLTAVIYIILLISHANDERYLYAVLRASQTVIGVFVAWLLNVWLFPYPGKNAKQKE